MTSATAKSVQRYRDPAYGELPAEVQAECARNAEWFAKKLDFYTSHPRRISRNLVLLGSLALLTTVSYYLWAEARAADAEAKAELLIFIAFFFLGALIPALVYYQRIRSLERPLVGLLIAQKFGWLHDPNHIPFQWQALAEKYREIFLRSDIYKGREIPRVGENGQEITGQGIIRQFWGEFRGIPFWSACLSAVGDPRRLGIREEGVYAFRLPRSVVYDFVLRPQSTWREREGRREKGIVTESNDFDQIFHIDYEGTRRRAGKGILQMLAPDVLEKLIGLQGEIGAFHLLFRDNVMIVASEKDWKMRHTDFTRKVALDPRDAQTIAADMALMLEAGEMLLESLD